jgi:small subunit ribosomal protein S1
LQHMMSIEAPIQVTSGEGTTTFEALLDDYDYQRPQRAELLEGVVLSADERQVLVDVGLKRDAIVPETDLVRLDQDTLDSLIPGATVTVYVMRPWGNEGGLIVSINKVLEETDWIRAQELMDNGEAIEVEVTGFNKGGLLADFGRLQGFIPQSHVTAISRSVPQSELKDAKAELIGERMLVKVIEVDRSNTRLILSQRAAQRAARRKQLEALEVGQEVTGKVVGIVDYGVFVDIGGVDGLVHISKLDRLHVKHPSDVLSIGDEVTVRVDDVDVERGRISLNRKALQPDPWDNVDEYVKEGDLVTGVVANVVNYGIFVALPHGFRGLLHVNEMSSYQVTDPHGFVEEGEEILVRIVEVDHARRRINMSLDAVTTEERWEWMAAHEEAAQALADEESVDEEPVAEEPLDEEPVAEESTDEEPLDEEPVAEEPLDEEPVAEESTDEEPLAEESTDEEPLAEEPAQEAAVQGEEEAPEALAEEVANG